MKLFLDTSILYDYFAGREPFYQNALQLFIMRMFGDVDLTASGKSYTDIFFSLKKYKEPQLIQQAFTDTLEVLSICSLDADDIRSACKLNWLDFEDALMAVSAEKVGADYLVTRDVGIRHSKVPTKTPEEIIAIMKERGLTYRDIDISELDLS